MQHSVRAYGRLDEVIVMYLRLRELRKDKALSQRKLAEILGMSQGQYSKYETGENVPTEMLVKLADFYQTSMDYILERTNNPTPPKPAGRI